MTDNISDNVIQFKEFSFKEAADKIEGLALTCPCGSQSMICYQNGDVQCTECEEFVNILCYIEEE